MDTRTGKIYDVPDLEAKQKLERELNTTLVPLTEKQAVELRPLSNRERKRRLKNGVCVCGSMKSFKKCCWKKYRRKHGSF